MRNATRRTKRAGSPTPTARRVHLEETRSPWDQHTLARDARSLNPNLLPHYIPSSKVSSSTILVMRGTNPSYSSSLRITLGEWRPCPSSSFHPSKLPLRTCAARSAGDEPHSPRAAPNLGFTLGEWRFPITGTRWRGLGSTAGH